MQTLDIQTKGKQLNPGIFIDIDGVVLKGGKPFDFSVQAINELWESEVPFVFVTNGTYCSEKLVKNLTDIFKLPFNHDHVVVAPSPCKGLFEFHDRRILACCQEDSNELIPELGFTDYITLTELVNIFPELDYVDHKRRAVLAKTPLTDEQIKKQNEFRPIEAIVLLGEPINWECALQVLIDVLMTNGDPRAKFKFVQSPHLPIIAANKDMTFKATAALPRFGHGAFLECLESLYMKITNNELVYEVMMGKPYLITYKYASDQIQRLSKNGEQINKFYIIGDNPDVDICGANVFKEFLMGPQELNKSRAASRRASAMHEFFGFQPHQLTLFNNMHKPVESILVCTGVYNPLNDYHFQIRNLLNTTFHNFETMSNPSKDEMTESMCGGSGVGGLSLVVPSNEAGRKNSTVSLQSSKGSSANLAENPFELREAFARRNSFISYFDNKLNIPDVTVPNFLEAVNYILACCRKS